MSPMINDVSLLCSPWNHSIANDICMMQPTLHFFQNGKKASEVIGADVERLRDTMEALYK